MGWWNSLHFSNIFVQCVILLLFCSISTTAFVEINEVMYAPSEAFGYDEWVELFNSGNEKVNLSSCFLEKKSLSPIELLPDDYLIITENKSNFYTFYNSSSFNGTIIEQNFIFNNDKADMIILNGTCSSQVNYTFSKDSYNYVGDFQKDHTLERRANGSWGESLHDGGSPGEQNSIWNIETIPTSISPNTTTNNSSYSNISIPSPEREPCNIGLSIYGDQIINDTRLNFTVVVQNEEKAPLNITIRGKIETLDKKIIKEYSPWTNFSLSNFSQKEKEYSPSIDGGIYLVTFYIEKTSCVDNDPSDNTIQKLFVLPDLNPPQNSTLSIDSINLGSDKKASWGDQLSLRLSIYKGNESKSEVKVWAEDKNKKVSKTTSFLLPEKNHLSTLTIPLQLDANCNQKIDADHIVIITEAFGLHTEKEIPIAGISSELCKTITVEKSVSSSSSLSSSSSSSSSKNRAASISIDLPPSITAGEVIRITAHLKGTASKKKFILSGYAYRGNTCYSCFNKSRDRDETLKTVTLDNQEEKDQDLLLKIDPDIDPGVLKVKVKMMQEDLKTPKEATAETYFLPVKSSVSSVNLTTPLLLARPSVVEQHNPPSTASSEESIPSSGIVVYESTSARTQKTIPYFLIGALALLSVSLILKRN